MLSRGDFLDSSTVAVLSAITGMTAGIGLTAIIAKLLHDSAIDKEQRKRNLIAKKDLIENYGKNDGYDVIDTYMTRLTSLYNTIQEQYGIDKRNEFEKIVMACALPVKIDERNSNNCEMVHIPDLSDGLSKRNWLKGSGVDQAILEIFEGYKNIRQKNKNGIDVNTAMMQILQNIIIVYKEFITESKMIPDEVIVYGKWNEDSKIKENTGKLKSVNKAMESFVSEIANTKMFRDRCFKFFKIKETSRQMNLPKIVKMIRDMGEEAVNFQNKLTLIDKSNEKIRKLWNYSIYFAQSIERMSEKKMYECLDIYSPYKRINRVISYDIQSRNDHVSDNDDLIANIIIKHIRNAYVTLFNDNNGIDGSGDYSHLNYMINVTDENSYDDLHGKINLPDIASVRVHEGEFTNKLYDDEVRNLIPDINRYFKYVYIAAAMQADLSVRLNLYGKIGLLQSGELEYRKKLIDVFIWRAKSIVNNDILGEESYFRKFIERTNDSEFINVALDEDDSIYSAITGNKNIIDADRDKQYGASFNKIFNISLNHMLHAEAMRKAGEEFHEMEKIDRQFSVLTKDDNLITYENNHTFKQSITIDNEFIYNIILASQDDEYLKNRILKISHPIQYSKIMNDYIENLNNIKIKFSNAFECYIFPQENIPTCKHMYTLVKTNDRKSYVLISDIYREFRLFMDDFTYHENPMFSINENGNFTTMKLNFQNKEGVRCFKQKIGEFINTFTTNFSREIQEEKHKKEQQKFLTSFIGNFIEIIQDIDKFNGKIDMSEATQYKLEKERQKLEFEKVIGQMRENHQIKTDELKMKIEKYQDDQKEIINKLFSKNNKIFENLINAVSEKTKIYISMMSDSCTDNDSGIKSSFLCINNSMDKLIHAQETLHKICDDKVENTEEININSMSVIDLNECLLNQVDNLSYVLNTTVPDSINAILAVVTSNTMDINEKYKSVIEQYENEIENLKNNENISSKEKHEADSCIVELNQQLKLLETELGNANTELDSQRRSIHSIDEKLKELDQLANKLLGIVENDEYITSRHIVNDGIEKFVKSGTFKIDQEYSSNSVNIDIEVHEIINNYNKLFTMINIADEVSTAIKQKIKEIISINNTISSSNTVVTCKIDEMIVTLNAHKNTIINLKDNIDKLQNMYDAARNSHINSLENQIQMMKNQEQKIMELNKEIKLSHDNHNATMEKINGELIENIKSLKQNNNELKQVNANLSIENAELNKSMNAMLDQHKSGMNDLDQIIREQEDRMHKTTECILANTLKNINDITMNVINTCEQSSKAQLIEQENYKNNILNIDNDLEQVKIRIDEMKSISLDNCKKNSSTAKINDNCGLGELKKLCKKLINGINSKNINRLRYGKYNDKVKWSWIETFTNELFKDNIGTEDFFNSFKTLLIVYLQNKDGNKWYNTRKTTIGKHLLEDLNDEQYTGIRRVIYGSNSTITYDQLADSLKIETELINKVKILINPDNNRDISLTINRFNNTDYDLSSLTLDSMIKNEKLENKHSNQLEKLVKEKLQNQQDKMDISNNIHLLNSQMIEMKEVHSLVNEISVFIRSIQTDLLKFASHNDHERLYRELNIQIQELNVIRNEMNMPFETNNILKRLHALNKQLNTIFTDGKRDKSHSSGVATSDLNIYKHNRLFSIKKNRVNGYNQYCNTNVKNNSHIIDMAL